MSQDWRDEVVSSGFIASCIRWVRELVTRKSARELRGVITARTENGPIACALIERTWRGQWTTEVVFALEGVDQHAKRPLYACFAGAQWAFWLEVQAALDRAMGARAAAPVERAKPDWSVN